MSTAFDSLSGGAPSRGLADPFAEPLNYDDLPESWTTPADPAAGLAELLPAVYAALMPDACTGEDLTREIGDGVEAASRLLTQVTIGEVAAATRRLLVTTRVQLSRLAAGTGFPRVSGRFVAAYGRRLELLARAAEARVRAATLPDGWRRRRFEAAAAKLRRKAETVDLDRTETRAGLTWAEERVAPIRVAARLLYTALGAHRSLVPAHLYALVDEVREALVSGSDRGIFSGLVPRAFGVPPAVRPQVDRYLRARQQELALATRA